MVNHLRWQEWVSLAPHEPTTNRNQQRYARHTSSISADLSGYIHLPPQRPLWQPSLLELEWSPNDTTWAMTVSNRSSSHSKGRAAGKERSSGCSWVCSVCLLLRHSMLNEPVWQFWGLGWSSVSKSHLWLLGCSASGVCTCEEVCPVGSFCWTFPSSLPLGWFVLLLGRTRVLSIPDSAVRKTSE